MKGRTKAWLRILAAALAVIVCSGIGLFLQRNREGLFFAAQKGDASVLERISVAGVLGDDFHSVSFASHGTAFTHKMRRQVLFAEGPAHHSVSYYYEPLPGTEVEREQSVSSDAAVGNPDGSFSPLEQSVLLETAGQFLLCLSDTQTSIGYYPYRLKTQVVYQKRLTVQYPVLEGEKAGVPHILDLPAGSVLSDAARSGFRNIVRLGERWYAITPTDAFCRGTGGIYDLTEQLGLPDWSDHQPPVTERENLYPIDLEDGSNEIVSIEACGELLAVFIRSNGVLKMHIVNPQTWRMERVVELPGWEQVPTYESFHVQGGYAVLTGRQDEDTLPDGTAEQALLCDVINLREGAVVERVRDRLPAPGGDRLQTAADALYADDTLYLLFYAGVATRAEEARQQRRYPYLIAYSGGRRVFECAVDSGQREDARARTPQMRDYQELRLQKEDD